MADGDELFLLKNCPTALSTGIQVNKHRKPFVWLPDEMPFYIRPEMVSRCVINIPDKARIKADRVEENVPIFKESIAITRAMPAAVQGGEARVEDEDELAKALGAEEVVSSSSASSAAEMTLPSPEAIPEGSGPAEPIEEEPPEEEVQGPSLTERLKEEAK